MASPVLVYTVAGLDPLPVTAERVYEMRCSDSPEDWFPDTYRVETGKDRGQYTPEAAAAIAECRECRFIVACGRRQLDIEGTVGVPGRQGIFGGMDPQDRWERMIQITGEKPRRGGGTAPMADAGPLQALLVEEKKRLGVGVSVDTRVADATGVSSDTIRMIRTGRRDQVREYTAVAIRKYFGVKEEGE